MNFSSIIEPSITFTKEQRENLDKEKEERRILQAEWDLVADRKEERRLLDLAVNEKIGFSQDRVRALKEVFHKNMKFVTPDELEVHNQQRAEGRAEMATLFRIHHIPEAHEHYSNLARTGGLENDKPDDVFPAKLNAKDLAKKDFAPPEDEQSPASKRPGGFAIREGLEREPNPYNGAYGVYGSWDAGMPEEEGYTRAFP